MAEKTPDSNELEDDTLGQKSDEDILSLARERFKLSEEAEKDIRAEALDDLKFLSGDQWPEEIKSQRISDNRPIITINRMPQNVRQVTNDQRQNRPAIKVFPVDDNADLETAKILQGMIKHIEYDSGADVAYDTALEGAAQKGFGYFRITTDYADHLSFNQKILIKQIPDHFKVRLDPFAKEPDGSDANWGFIFDDVQKDDYLSEHKESELASEQDWELLGATRPGWMDSKSCRIAEYFYKEFEDLEIVQLSDGNVGPKKDLPEVLPIDPRTGVQISIVSERTAKVPVIKWCKINGLEVLEKTELPGQYIPIIPVYGATLNIDGEVIRESVIRHAKDPQRNLNYFVTMETEAIALAPKAPFIGAEGQFEGYEGIWRSANLKNHAFLPYKPTSLDGSLVPPPQRNAYEPPVGAITGARMQASEDIKTTTGIYDSSLGNRSNETSGIAIQRRNQQAQTSNFHFNDNLTRSLRHAGRIILSWIPVYYDTAQAIRILGEEGDQEIVRINEIFSHKGKDVNYDVSIGKYDVIVETGPSYATKRQEASDYMIQFLQAYPAAAPFIGDLIAKNQDWPGASEIAERLKKAAPPGVIEDKNAPQIPPEIQQKLEQSGQMVEQLTQALKQAEDEIKIKKYELDSKERIETMKLENQAAIELAKLESKEAIESLFAQMKELDARTKQLGMNAQYEDEENQQDLDFNEPQGSQPTDGFSSGEQQPTGGLPPGVNGEYP